MANIKIVHAYKERKLWIENPKYEGNIKDYKEWGGSSISKNDVEVISLDKGDGSFMVSVGVQLKNGFTITFVGWCSEWNSVNTANVLLKKSIEKINKEVNK